MRVLYISDRKDGGILRHVRCLRECLPPEVETFEIGNGGDEEFAGKSGHDIREIWQIRRVIRTFHPDIVHFHIPALMMVAYVRFIARLPIVRSWHTPTTGKEGLRRRLIRWWFGRMCFYLPVSGPTWEGLKRWSPRIRGEVFYNPVQIDNSLCPHPPKGEKGLTVGMVGRNADQKDWPSFHKVEAIVKTKMPQVEFVNGGEYAPCDGKAVIRGLDVFVMTSKHEELPTTLLECFQLGTAACGFIPVGGVTDILQYSNGPLKDVFIQERDSAKLADIVIALLNDATKRQAVIEDGWQILCKYFDAEKIVHEVLIPSYKKILIKTI